MRECCRGRARKVPDRNKGGKEKRQVGVVDHVEIGDDVIVGAQAGVTRDIAPGLPSSARRLCRIPSSSGSSRPWPGCRRCAKS